MTSASVSLPQVTLLQPKTSAVATAVPFLKAFAPNSCTTTVTCTSTVPTALQVTSSGTSTAAPRASSLAGDSTWTSRNNPPEKNATAGPEAANSASRPPRRRATTAVATLVRFVLIRFLFLDGNGWLVGRSGVGCWEHQGDSQRHSEHDGWQVPDKVEAAVDGEGCRRRGRWGACATACARSRPAGLRAGPGPPDRAPGPGRWPAHPGSARPGPLAGRRPSPGAGASPASSA